MSEQIVDYDAKGCGCCTDGVHKDGPEIVNRPALPAIHYHIGTYGSFRRAMIEAIATQPQLAGWTARDATDYGMAVIDMWAYLGDILTFYQERIANEAFLRTAVQRDSVMRLAALLDYRPSPGAAATTYVALFLEKEKSLAIPIGLRIQSVPGQNEKPQKFETVETIAASAALNAIRVHGLPVAFNPFAQGSTGGPLLVPVGVAPGVALAIFDAHGIERKHVAAIDPEDLAWSPGVQRSGLTALDTRAVATGRQFALFGSTTPATTLVHTVSNDKTLNVNVTTSTLTTSFGMAGNPLPLDRIVADIQAGSRMLIVRSADGNKPAAVRMATVKSAEAKPAEIKAGSTVLGAYSAMVTEVAFDMRAASKPSAAAGNDFIAVVTTAEDGSVWSNVSADGWIGWQSLGGNFDEVVMAAGKSGKRQIIGRDIANQLWLFGSDGWSAFGDGALPVAGTTANALAFVVARGSDSRPRYRRQLASGEWGLWQPLDGEKCDRIAVTTRSNGALEVFIRRIGSHDVFARREVTPDGQWTAWEPLGGVVQELAAGVHENGAKVEVFGIGGNNALWRKQRTGNNWAPSWSSLGGWIDRLAIDRSKSGYLWAFARGKDGRIYQKHQVLPNSSDWSDWESTFELKVESLTTSHTQTGGLVAFAQGTEETLVWNAGNWGHLGVPMFDIFDRRRVTLLEVLGDPIPLAMQKHPALIGGSVVLASTGQLASIAKGRTIILDDAKKQPLTATVVSSTTSGGFLHISFAPALTRNLDAASATLYGNVAKVTHGETVKTETLGSGAASARFQTFGVAKSPVTFVPQAGARNGVGNTLEVRVDGVKWTEVETLQGRGKDERVFTTRVSEDDKMTVQFGGEPGARLTTGRSNVTAKYRVGLGAEGNIRAAALTNLLDRPPGLKSATNPGPAEGGAAAESLDGIRVNAPNTIRTFSRIVSLLDFEDAAREHATVAKARATWHLEDFERVVSLTVAPEGGAVLSNAALAVIAADLDAKRDTNRPMRIRAHENVPFLVTAVLQADAAYLLENVQKSAEDALAAYFSFARRELGQAVHLSDVYALLQGVPGVVGARITKLKRRSGGPTIADHVLLLPHQIAQLALPEDAVVTPQFATL
jgi:uncharacterized phage protein gp47/JayE